MKLPGQCVETSRLWRILMIVIYGISSMDNWVHFGWTQLIAAAGEVHSEFVMQQIDEEGM